MWKARTTRIAFINRTSLERAALKADGSRSASAAVGVQGTAWVLEMARKKLWSFKGVGFATKFPFAMSTKT